MGALGKIRNRSGLLLAVIGFAMLAFILGDFMQSKRSGSSGTFYVGEVLGENIHIQNFEILYVEGFILYGPITVFFSSEIRAEKAESLFNFSAL